MAEEFGECVTNYNPYDFTDPEDPVFTRLGLGGGLWEEDAKPVPFLVDAKDVESGLLPKEMVDTLSFLPNSRVAVISVFYKGTSIDAELISIKNQNGYTLVVDDLWKKLKTHHNFAEGETLAFTLMASNSFVLNTLATVGLPLQFPISLGACNIGEMDSFSLPSQMTDYVFFTPYTTTTRIHVTFDMDDIDVWVKTVKSDNESYLAMFGPGWIVLRGKIKAANSSAPSIRFTQSMVLSNSFTVTVVGAD